MTIDSRIIQFKEIIIIAKQLSKKLGFENFRYKFWNFGC